MKRDSDLIRDILLKIEENDSDEMYVEDLITAEYDGKKISYHIQLLLDAGYIGAIPIRTLGQPYAQFIINRLTMKGCDYLDNVRDDKVWQETKNIVLKSVGSASLEIVKNVAISVITKFIGI